MLQQLAKLIGQGTGARLLRIGGALCLALVCCGHLAAQTPRDSLAQYVPSDAGLFVELRDATARARAFLDSPMYARLAAQPGFRRWADESVKVFRQLSQELAARLEVNEHELWEEVLGRRAALAIWPPRRADGLPDANARPATALLVDTGRPAVAEKLLAGLRAAAAQKRGVRLTDAQWAGQTYWIVDQEAHGEGPRVHLATSASLVVVCDDQRALHRLLDLIAGRGTAVGQPPDNLAALPEFSAAAAELWPDGALRAFIQPRVWEPLVAAEVERAPAGESSDRQPALAVWRAMQYVAMTADIQPGLRFDLVIKLRPAALPDEVRDVLAAFSGRSAVLERIPADCLAAVSTRIDVGRLLRAAGQQPVRERGAPDVGTLLAQRVVSHLGPEAAMYLTTPPAGEANQVGDANRSGVFPLVAVAAVGIAAESASTEAALRSLLHDALPALVNWNTAASAVQPAMQLHTWVQRGVKITSLRPMPGAPPGVQPSYAVHEGFLWGGSTPEAIVQAVRNPAESLAQRAEAAHLAPAAMPPNHVLYVNTAALRAVLAQHGERIAADLAAARQMESHDIYHGLDRLAAALQLVDTAWLAVRIREDCVAASLVLHVDAVDSPPAAASPR